LKPTDPTPSPGPADAGQTTPAMVPAVIMQVAIPLEVHATLAVAAAQSGLPVDQYTVRTLVMVCDDRVQEARPTERAMIERLYVNTLARFRASTEQKIVIAGTSPGSGAEVLARRIECELLAAHGEHPHDRCDYGDFEGERPDTRPPQIRWVCCCYHARELLAAGGAP